MAALWGRTSGNKVAQKRKKYTYRYEFQIRTSSIYRYKIIFNKFCNSVF
jgi:hypothetical protein